MKIVVTGATGQQGGALARRLLADGHAVRAFTRSPVSGAAATLTGLGAEVVAADMADAASLPPLMGGADALFAMGTPFEAGADAEVAHGTNLFEAAARADVPHIVYSSVASAHQDTGIPHFDSKALLEDRLADLGIPWTVVAPTYFMENATAPWALPALAQGVHALALPPDSRLQQISVRNVADVVAAILARPGRFAGSRIELAADAPSGVEQARLLSRALGRAISYRAVSLDDLRAQPMGGDNALMFGWFQEVGYSVDIAAVRRTFPDVTWEDFASWAGRQSSVVQADAGLAEAWA